MRWRRALAVAALVAVAGCGGSRVSTRPAAGPLTSADPCPPGPPARASILSVTNTGHIAWQHAIANPHPADEPLPPLILGRTGVWATGNQVVALHLNDGSPVWTRPLGDIDGLWPTASTVVVLSDQVSAHANLTSIDLTTGANRWQMDLGAGIIGDPVATSDGGLAFQRQGSVHVVDLATGKSRWSAPADGTGLTVTAGLVITTRSGSILGLDQAHGQPRWQQSATNLDEVTQTGDDLTTLDGLVLVDSATEGGTSSTATVALDPATGQRRWTFDVGTDLQPAAAGPGGLLLDSGVPRRAYLVDPTTGHIRWQITTFISDDTAPVITASTVLSVEGGVQDFPTTALVQRSATTGAVIWSTPLGGGTDVSQPGITTSPVQAVIAVLQPNNQTRIQTYSRTNGQELWSLPLPYDIGSSPVMAGDGYLVQTGTDETACALASADVPAGR